MKYTAPEGDGAAMLVELENDSNVYSKGKCALDDFHDISQESQRTVCCAAREALFIMKFKPVMTGSRFLKNPVM